MTTGPGGTNALTGVLCSYLDSIPMFVLSGQVKWSMTVRCTGVEMRTYGDQEYDIVKAVAPMSKYAVMVTVPEMIKYHLEKALFLATHGRPGPVWIDVPLNIQWGYVDTDDLVEFNPVELESTLPRKTSLRTYEEVLERIKNAKRPVIFSGVELRTNGAYDSFIKLINKLNVPVVTTFAAGEPEIIPIRAEERIAVFAGPPRKRPAPAKAMSTNHWPAPNVSRKLPKMTKHTI